ncbi:hypothetical protein NQ315_015940 [Exocentrus adspersus]|uniref:Uncharacterized protein n=1 Tax=Exocentrus adspersus TaxID=1586481 RepID=A0AAV8VCD5_9CUCU|nr:hypothetical protein NQ315_015940 [Exocentrus adspersus]
MTHSDVDNKEYKLTLNLVGKHNVQQVLKFCHDLMAGEIIRHGNNGADVFKDCLNGINVLMSKSSDFSLAYFVFVLVFLKINLWIDNFQELFSTSLVGDIRSM